MKTGMPGSSSVNTPGLSTDPSRDRTSSSQNSSPTQPAMGASNWHGEAAVLGRGTASNLYRQASVSDAAKANPKVELEKELNSAEAMEAFLKANPAGKIKTAFEGKGKNLVHIAAQYGSPEALQVVLDHVGQLEKSEREAILNTKSTTASYEMTPLNLAAWCPNREKAVALLAKTPGVDLNAKNSKDMTPLMSAELWSNTASLEVLLSEPGVNVNAQDAHGRTVLARAAIDGRAGNMAVLLKHDESRQDLDVNAPDHGGMTAVQHALGEKKTEAAHLLLAHEKTDLTTRDPAGITPLARFLALGTQDLETLQLFLKRDDVAKFINLRNTPEEVTALMIADMLPNPALFNAILNAPGLDANVKAKNGRAILGMAAVNDHADNIKAILHHPDIKVDVNDRDDDGFTALHSAVAKGHQNSFDVLAADPRVDLNATDYKQRTPAHFAASMADVKLLEKMYATQTSNRKFDMDKPGPNGETPFMYVAVKRPSIDSSRPAPTAQQQKEAVQLFLDKGGINFNAQQTRERLTSLGLAGFSKNWDVFDLMMQHPKIDPNFQENGVDLLKYAMMTVNDPNPAAHAQLGDLSPLVKRLVDSDRITGDKTEARQWLAQQSGGGILNSIRSWIPGL